MDGDPRDAVIGRLLDGWTPNLAFTDQPHWVKHRPYRFELMTAAEAETMAGFVERSVR